KERATVFCAEKEDRAKCLSIDQTLFHRCTWPLPVAASTNTACVKGTSNFVRIRELGACWKNVTLSFISSFTLKLPSGSRRTQPTEIIPELQVKARATTLCSRLPDPASSAQWPRRHVLVAGSTLKKSSPYASLPTFEIKVGSFAHPDAAFFTPAQRSFVNPRTTPQHYKNLVLASLPKSEIARLQPHLSPVTLKLRQQLLDGHGTHVYFVEEGLASVVLSMQNGTTVEVGVIGKDGIVGLPMLLGG